MTTQALDPVDAAWYHMDGPANPAIVTAVALTSQPLEFGKVRAALKQRLLGFERFRQRVVERGVVFATPVWEDAPDFDIDRHVHRAALPSPRDEHALLALVSDLASQPLDHALPLWQAHVVEQVGHGSALVLRYHHCIGDGAAMMSVASRLFEWSHRRRRATLPLVPVAEQGLLDVAMGAVGAASSVVVTLLQPADPPSPFKGTFAASQRVAWSRPVAIADVKAIGAATGAKVNDVLVAAAAGALRSYLRSRGVDVRHTTLRAMVPVNLRSPERMKELGNAFGLVILDLPVGAATGARRLALTKARMDKLKRSPQAMAMQTLLDLFGRGPKTLEDMACTLFGSKASMVMTNVAGPREPVRLAGVLVERLMFCVPHPGNELGMGISIFSYRGRATLTIVADAGLVPDPQSITRAFDREIAGMQRTVVTSRTMVAKHREPQRRESASRR
jgi:hypothetical protein